MSRFYVSKDAVKDGEIFLSGNEAHHIVDVLRLQKNDAVVAFDGAGKEYTGFIKSAKKKRLVITIQDTKEIFLNDEVKILLFQAIPKKDRMDYIVEKATELGVYSIIPMITERTIIRLNDEKKDARRARWQRIAAQASQQCGRLSIPDIARPVLFKKAIAAFGSYDKALIACLDEDTQEVKKVLAQEDGNRIAVCIGPEGDFTKKEVAAAKSSGAVSVTLGPRVLKSDTAGIALLSIIGYEFNSR